VKSNLDHWLAHGLHKRAAAADVEEAAKQGMLRGGTAGVLAADGTAYGKCPRVAYLRAKGIQPAIEPAALELFEAGYASEPAILSRLALGLPEGYSLGTPEQMDFTWTTDSGMVVSGRPDGGVFKDGQLQFGIELKLAASMWTVFSVTYDLRPKSDHLIQAAHYSWRHGGAPFALVYSCRAEYHVSTAPKFIKDKFTPGAKAVDFKDGKPFKIRPHTTVYELTWNADGFWEYLTDGMERPCPTVITQAGIKAWYEAVATMDTTDALPPRPGILAVDGSKSYDPCSYCDFAPQCEQYEFKGRQAWMDHVMTATKKGAQ
jgi:hypothetical protein